MMRAGYFDPLEGQQWAAIPPEEVSEMRQRHSFSFLVLRPVHAKRDPWTDRVVMFCTALHAS